MEVIINFQACICINTIVNSNFIFFFVALTNSNLNNVLTFNMTFIDEVIKWSSMTNYFFVINWFHISVGIKMNYDRILLCN